MDSHLLLEVQYLGEIELHFIEKYSHLSHFLVFDTYKDQVTQVPTARTITIQMHALDRLKCSTQNTPTLIQPIEGVHLYRYPFHFRYQGPGDFACTLAQTVLLLYPFTEC